MNASEYNRLRDYRLAKLSEYTGKLIELERGYLIERLPSTGVRKLTGDHYPTHANEIAVLDAMLYAIETVKTSYDARSTAVQDAWEAYKDDDGTFPELSEAIEAL